METKLITMKEATELLGVTRSTVDRYVRAGLLTKVKYGTSQQASVRFREDELLRMIGARPTNADAARSATVNADRAAEAASQEVTYRPKSW